MGLKPQTAGADSPFPSWAACGMVLPADRGALGASHSVSAGLIHAANTSCWDLPSRYSRNLLVGLDEVHGSTAAAADGAPAYCDLSDQPNARREAIEGGARSDGQREPREGWTGG